MWEVEKKEQRPNYCFIVIVNKDNSATVKRIARRGVTLDDTLELCYARARELGYESK
jgi:hypothetical protein